MALKDAVDNCRVSFAILGTLHECVWQSSGAIGLDAGAGARVGAGDVAGAGAGAGAGAAGAGAAGAGAAGAGAGAGAGADAGAGAGASRTPHSVRKLPIAYYTHNDQQQL